MLWRLAEVSKKVSVAVDFCRAPGPQNAGGLEQGVFLGSSNPSCSSFCSLLLDGGFPCVPSETRHAKYILISIPFQLKGNINNHGRLHS